MNFFSSIFKSKREVAAASGVQADAVVAITDAPDESVLRDDTPGSTLDDDQIESFIDFIARRSIEGIDYGQIDPMFEEVARFVVECQQGSTSAIQRRFSIGYNRAGRLMNQLQSIGIVGRAEGSLARKILMTDMQQLDSFIMLANERNERLESFVDEYSSEIEERKAYYRDQLIKQQEQQRFDQEKELIKQKVRDRTLRQKAREIAMQELADEGIITNQRKRKPISQEIQDRVWNRDGGKCVKCGSQENLEFDHIIPHSKGGANTARNLQLLCQRCNREKSNNIG